MSEIDFDALNKINQPGGEGNFKYRLAKFGVKAIALLLLSMEMIDDVTGLTSLRGKRGLWYFDRKMALGKYNLSEVVKSLENDLLVRREGEKFYITPKGRRRARLLRLQAPVKVPENNSWNGKYYFAIFDIPEDKRDKRNLLRSILKRKGFIKLQNSVFVAAYADLEELDMVRIELGIEKYVNFLIAESGETDDDSLLRKKFGLTDSRKRKKLG